MSPLKGPLARQLILSFAGLGLIAVSISIGSVWCVQFTSRTLATVATQVNTAALSANIRSESLSLTDLVRRYTLTPITSGTDLPQHIEAQQALLDTLLSQALARTDPNDMDESFRISQVRQYLIAFSSQTSRVIANFETPDTSPAEINRELMTLIQHYQMPLIQALQDFEAFESDRAEISQQKAERVITITVSLLILIAGLVFVAVLRMSYQVMTRIVTPLTALQTGVEAFRFGEPDQEIQVHRRDEIGGLATAFNTMSTQLYAAHQKIRAYMTTLEQQVAERTEIARRKAEEAERANQAKSIFLANMSHELRTPLNVILGFTQLMERAPHTPEERETLRIIQRSGEHLLSLINQVLDLSKIEAGRITVNKKSCDIYRLVNEMNDMFSLKAQQQGIRCLIDYMDDVPSYVRTDEVKLRQVLINLLNNAIKFTKEGGVTLHVTTLPEDHHDHERSSGVTLQFSISDTGPGIAPEEMDRLFEAFAQTDTGRRAQEGTGLGLRISRKFVQLLGGDITVNSKVGMGTTFSFCIQAEIGHPEHIETIRPPRRVLALEPNQRAADGSRYRLLIVDDKPDNRQILVKLLSPFGFDLREASQGQEALDIWNEWEPHLIWMDLRMPVLDGAKATQRIKATSRGKQTVIIILSASVIDDEETLMMTTGCDAFLRKPFRESEVFDLLRTHLGVRFLYEEHAQSPIVNHQSSGEPVLTPHDLAALPEGVATQLRQAVEALDIETALRCIERIHQQNESLAHALTAFVKDYRFDRLQELFENGDEAS